MKKFILKYWSVILVSIIILLSCLTGLHWFLNNNKINDELNSNKEYTDKVEAVGNYDDWDKTFVVRLKKNGDWKLNTHILANKHFVNKTNVAPVHFKKNNIITYIKVKDIWTNKEKIIIKKVE